MRYATAKPGQAGSSQVKGSGVADGHLVESRRAFRPLRLRLLQQVLEQGAVHAYRCQLGLQVEEMPGALHPRETAVRQVVAELAGVLGGGVFVPAAVDEMHVALDPLQASRSPDR